MAINPKKLTRTIVYINQKCSQCEKDLKREEIVWVFIKDKKEIKGLIGKQQIEYYCIPCGNKIIEQGKSSGKISGQVCFAPNCKNKIKKEYYQCRDSKKKFCSQRHFEEVYGLYCSCCGKEFTEQINYLEKVQPEKTTFQKLSPWLLGFSIILITMIMTVLVKKEEKRKFSKLNLTI